MFVNSQLVCLWLVGILNNAMFNSKYLFQLFAQSHQPLCYKHCCSYVLSSNIVSLAIHLLLQMMTLLSKLSLHICLHKQQAHLFHQNIWYWISFLTRILIALVLAKWWKKQADIDMFQPHSQLMIELTWRWQELKHNITWLGFIFQCFWLHCNWWKDISFHM